MDKFAASWRARLLVVLMVVVFCVPEAFGQQLPGCSQENIQKRGEIEDRFHYSILKLKRGDEAVAAKLLMKKLGEVSQLPAECQAAYCPPWAVRKIVEFTQGQQARINERLYRGMDELAAALEDGRMSQALEKTLPPACSQSQPTQGSTGNEWQRKQQCQNKWDEFHRCEREFKRRLGTPLELLYTCFRPTCVRY